MKLARAGKKTKEPLETRAELQIRIDSAFAKSTLVAGAKVFHFYKAPRASAYKHFHFPSRLRPEMVLQEIERVVCERCKQNRREMVYKVMAKGTFNESELKIGGLLGSGGFGSVYEARFRGERIAVKKLHKGIINERAARESFEAESSVLHFHHPNIVRTLAVQTLMDAQCIIMEFAGERNLMTVIYDPCEELDAERRTKFALDIAQGLQFAHRQGIAHLDLKPGNVLVSEKDHCKLADFGCCQAVEENHKPASPTKSNLTGTYAYRAPELLRGESPTTKADIYSFGVCLWQMLTRERPYGKENQHVVIFGVVAYQLRPELSEELTGDEQFVIRQCWQAEAKVRPTASEIIVKLKAIGASPQGNINDELSTDRAVRAKLCARKLCSSQRKDYANVRRCLNTS